MTISSIHFFATEDFAVRGQHFSSSNVGGTKNATATSTAAKLAFLFHLYDVHPLIKLHVVPTSNPSSLPQIASAFFIIALDCEDIFICAHAHGYYNYRAGLNVQL